MKKLALLFALVFAGAGCEKDFDTINENPYSPTTTSMEALFNGVVESLQLGWNEQFYVHNEKLYEATQQAALTSRAWLNTAIGIDEIWNNYYATLKNIREIERRFAAFEAAGGSPEELKNVRAMLKIITAYKTFRVTDLFGDIPFFDAGRGIEDLQYLRPKYDSQEAIYKALLDDLKWAADNIEIDPSATAPSSRSTPGPSKASPPHASLRSSIQNSPAGTNRERLRNTFSRFDSSTSSSTPVSN